jgi:teichuronic acid biosynthesis glycosyltransferase TuaC
MHKDELRVLVVSRLYPRPSDPVLGIFVEEEVKQLSSRCQVQVISPIPWFPPLKLFEKWYAYTRIPVHQIRQGIEVFRPRTIAFPRNFLFSLLGFSFYFSLLRCAGEIERGFPFDLIHAHTAYPDGFGAVMLGRAMKRPIVVTLHGGDITMYFKRYLWRKLGLWALSNADRMIAVSTSLCRIVVEGYGVAGDKVTVIPNGIDGTKFVPMPRVEALERLELEGEGSRILYVGGIKRSKGIDYLLKAVKRLVETSPRPIELLIIGEGEYEQRAKLLAKELGIASTVSFFGKRPNPEIPLWINACDLLVLPSLSEGLGVVLIEAMACGKPVVATRCGGPEDIVSPGTGILVPPRDDAALAKAIQEVLGDADRFDPRRIRRHAMNNYAYDRISSRIVDVYTQVLRN